MKLSDVERKPLDILSDPSEIEVYCLSDPSELVSDLTVTLSNINENVPSGLESIEARMLNGESVMYQK